MQWDTSVHDWLEGRGERLYLIAMIDDATSRVFARFAYRDTAEENMRVQEPTLKRGNDTKRIETMSLNASDIKDRARRSAATHGVRGFRREL